MKDIRREVMHRGYERVVARNERLGRAEEGTRLKGEAVKVMRQGGSDAVNDGIHYHLAKNPPGSGKQRT